jgi:osmotically-inducible protein OsmY
MSRHPAVWLVAAAAVVTLTAGCSRETRNEANREVEQAGEATEQAAQQAAGELGDAWTTTKIEAKYFGDADVKGRNIDVTTSGGVVTLTGTVDSERARQQAVAIARQTEGVSRVEDRLVVGAEREDRPVATGGSGAEAAAPAEAPPATGTAATGAAGRSNAWITTEIQSKYFGDPSIKSRRIDVAASNGVVTLTGTVGSQQERESAVRLARETEGVRRVNDQLRVGTEALGTPAPVSGAAAEAGEPTADAGTVSRGLEQERMSDAGITARVQSKFFLDDRVKARNIDVSTSNGTVTLDGSVTTESERRHALSIARSVAGVREVTDNLDVAPGADAARVGTPEMGPLTAVEDAWVTTKIQSKYFLDELVKGRRVDVETQNGVVTLSGEVQSQTEKRRAEELARDTDGVIRVQNRLAIGDGAATTSESPDAQPMR